MSGIRPLIYVILIVFTLSLGIFGCNGEKEAGEQEALDSAETCPSQGDGLRDSKDSAAASLKAPRDNPSAEESRDDSVKPDNEGTQLIKLGLQDSGSEKQPDTASLVPGGVDSSKEGFSISELSDEVKQRITGISYPEGCSVPYNDLRYLTLKYVDYNGVDSRGELICNKDIAADLLDIFYNLYVARYPIAKIRLVDEYGGDDTLSMTDDNTSCFNYRVVEGTTHLSKHALGRAVDINPFYNPYVTHPNGGTRISPPGSEPYADREADFPHKIGPGDLAYEQFTSHGFEWGGNWRTLKDYQHFQK